MRIILFGLIFILANFAQAQVNDGSPLSPQFRNLPTAVKCELIKMGSMGGADARIGTAEISVLLEDAPVIAVRSNVKEANFVFGRRQSAGNDSTQTTDYCSYVYDASMPEQRTLKYFCSDRGEKSWMNNTFSAITLSNSTMAYTKVCKEAEYRNPALSNHRCWKLANCK